MQRYPEGAPPRVIAQALMITEDDVELIYPKIVEKLQGLMQNQKESTRAAAREQARALFAEEFG